MKSSIYHQGTPPSGPCPVFTAIIGRRYRCMKSYTNEYRNSYFPDPTRTSLTLPQHYWPPLALPLTVLFPTSVLFSTCFTPMSCILLILLSLNSILHLRNVMFILCIIYVFMPVSMCLWCCLKQDFNCTSLYLCILIINLTTSFDFIIAFCIFFTTNNLDLSLKMLNCTSEELYPNRILLSHDKRRFYCMEKNP